MKALIADKILPVCAEVLRRAKLSDPVNAVNAHFLLDANPQGPMLIVGNDDRPGMAGRIGTSIGAAPVNIACLSLGRDRSGGRAIAIFNLDSPVPGDLLGQIARIDGVLWAERAIL